MATPASIERDLLLANRLADAEEFEAAIAAYCRVLDADPGCTAAWFNLGRTFQDAERYEDAAASYLQAIELEPGFRDAGLNLGIVLRILGRVDDAVSLFDELIAADPHDAQAHLQRSLTRLAAGDFAAGWNEYHWRWQTEVESRHDSDQPLWDGRELVRGTLLLMAEQGIGDEIQFASCLPDVIPRVGRVILECEPRLAPLFARSFPAITVVPTATTCTDFDAHLPIGDLPRFFRRSLSQFPQRRSWLVPETAAVAAWKSRYAALGGRRTVGVAWRGGRKPLDRRSRSLDLATWRPILQTPDVNFINLQHGNVNGEVSAFAESTRLTLHDFAEADPLHDLDGYAAKIAAVDLVITVDNSTVHLAGALGKPVWTLLPFAADYRWMQRTDRSPWYPTLRLFRQPRPGDWSDVMQTIARSLHAPPT